MAVIRWRGGAPSIAQVTHFTFGGTWEVDDVVRVTFGTKTVDFTAGSTVITTIIDSIVTAWAALDSDAYPEFAELTPTRVSNDLVLTAATAGTAFTATLTPLEVDFSPADAQTIEGGGIATTGTITTANSSGNDWSNGTNWTGGSVPTTGDTVYLEYSDNDITDGLDQSGVTLAALYVTATFTGTLGRPKQNASGTEYPEYRDDYLKIGATLCFIGGGAGNGSGRIKINFGTIQTACTVYASGSSLDTDVEPILLRGTHASNTLTVMGGIVGVAVYDEETATIATYDQEGDSTVRMGSQVTLATVVKIAGTLTLNCAVGTSLRQEAGACAINGTGAVAALNVFGGILVYNTTGTLGGNPVVSGNGFLDFDQDQRAKTVTNAITLKGAQAGGRDNAKVVNNLRIIWDDSQSGSWEFGKDLTLTRS